MRIHLVLPLALGLLFAVHGAQAQTPNSPAQPAQASAPSREPAGDAPTTNFNETGIFEPHDLERINMEVPREGTTYLTFQRRFVVLSGSATKNMQMDFTFSSVLLRHSGTAPGNANLTVRIADGRTVFLNVRSLPQPSADRYAFIR